MRILKTKNGEGYIWLAVLVLFLSLLTSVLLLYLGLCGQVLNERRERKQALDSYLAEFAKASYDAIRQGDGYADANAPHCKYCANCAHYRKMADVDRYVCVLHNHLAHALCYCSWHKMAEGM